MKGWVAITTSCGFFEGRDVNRANVIFESALADYLAVCDRRDAEIAARSLAAATSKPSVHTA